MDMTEDSASGLYDPMRCSDVSDYEHPEEEDELRKAARAGILLLEKNQELQNENAALRAQLEVLESERPKLHDGLKHKEDELQLLREERKKNMLEVNTLRGELRAKSTMITDLLDREQRQKEESDEAKRLADYQLDRLSAELDEMLRKKTAEQPTAAAKEVFAVPNPAASYDSNQASVFTLADYEELMQKWQAASEENEHYQIELKSARKDVDGMRRKLKKVAHDQEHVERLEKKVLKLQHASDALQEEITEQRALIESLRTMNGIYKKIAESRPFSTECTCALHPAGDEEELGKSVQKELVETNKHLEEQLRELRVRLESDSHPEIEAIEDNNVDHHTVPDKPIAHSSSGDSLSLMSRTPATSEDFGETDAVQDNLMKKVQDLQEKLSVSKDMLKHTKQQWQSAIASQKALEECNRTAQDEITRLTQLLDYQMSMPTRRRSSAVRPVDGEESNRSRKFTDSDEDDDKWMEETAPYPAPPGDLNSPLIKCLLDHWTTDKSKVMHLTDWLHHAIRGTGKPTPLRLENLSSEVAAGFTQLLVPILRERHGVSVTIYRRDSVQILSDMILQAHQPSQSTGLFASLAAKVSSIAASTGLAAPDIDAVVSDPALNGGRNKRRQDGPGPMSEAQFLYG
ncbi:hypothetical protein Poli38472_000996 [Pythium oligandrum]|uniref:Uncharacterized protein n=1 Tax=Pythium oligandrum TaxID=41045 RepID=A0A8K1CCP2_PYTOL|nr:hypothetical protein Poli38472_000996 [Pythium oligandrum]|eukprot:TMW60954.1 hypothetical protein Poli38472_000996 [Pythium oligandrum]